MKKYVKRRHRFFFATLRPIVRILARSYHFKTKAIRTERGKNYLILSNHQGFLDPAFIALTIKRPIYFVINDAVDMQKWYFKLLFYCFGPIKKRKGFADAACIRAMCQTAREGGNVAVFPEGNRQWNDSVFYIDRAVVKLVRLLKLSVILYNFNGGYGVQPRWGKSKRKGKHVGYVREIIEWDEITSMPDDELYERIRTGLKVIDSDSGELYRSNERAEYLERELFVCPKCGASSTLHSHGNEVTCDCCGLTVSYGEDLRLSSRDPDFHFDKLVDWYEFQQQYVRDYDLNSATTLLTDCGLKLFDKTERRVLLSQGRLTLTKDALTVGDFTVSTADIFGGSMLGGTKLTFNAGDKSYLIEGFERFNGIKYLLFFNRVCKQIADKGGDKYYGL